MRSIIGGLACAIAASGCASAGKIAFDVGAGDGTFLVDKTPRDAYPPFLAAEGNVYSCRYGVHHLAKGDFQPPGPQTIAALLARSRPELAGHQVELQRLDVFHNYRRRALGQAGMAIGGFVGDAMIRSSQADEGVRVSGDFLFDLEPLRARAPGARMIGCDDAHEGEFDAAQVSGNADVIVTWITLSVDGTAYPLRSLRAFRFTGKEQLQPMMVESITRSVEELGKAIQLP